MIRQSFRRSSPVFQFLDHLVPAENPLADAVFDIDADVDDVISRFHEIGYGISSNPGPGFFLHALDELALCFEEARLGKFMPLRDDVPRRDHIFACRGKRSERQVEAVMRTLNLETPD